MCCYHHHGYCSIWVAHVTSLWIIIKKIHGILHAPKLCNIINYFSFRSLADADKILLIYLFHVNSYIWNMGTLMTIEFSSTRWHLISPAPHLQISLRKIIKITWNSSNLTAFLCDRVNCVQSVNQIPRPGWKL